LRLCFLSCISYIWEAICFDMNNRLIRETVINYLEVLCKDGESADTKVARNEMIQGYVEDELMALNEEFRKVQANQMQKWKHSNLDIYKTKYFKKFILNNHESYSNVYKKLLKTCIINKDTIESFLTGGNTQVKTKDFFTAFINYVEKKYNHLIISDVPKPKPNVVEIKKAESLDNDNQKLIPKLSGAELINKEFINRISNERFSLSEFYTAKHDDRCQWFGILKKWDIKREIYTKVFQTLFTSFDKDRKNKVAAVILGEGGSGKSIFQMRLAHDLAVLETHKVLWIVDFEEFIKKDVNSNNSAWDKVKDDVGFNYFLFIEDWYSQVDNNGVAESKKFLESTQNYQHVRIVVGDRDIQGKKINNQLIPNTYVDHIFDDNNRFDIPLEENRYVIEQVLLKLPKWKEVIKEDFDYEQLNKAPLFMLLFIIAKVSEENNLGSIDLSEPHIEFRKTIKSNLKKLQDLNCTGIAKALYYWSFIYSEFRIQISYDSLLILAEYFKDSGDRNPLLFKNLKLRGKVTGILNSFIGIRIHNQFYNQKQFYFNHDILSDYGLSKVIYQGWEKYDEILLKTILNVIIDMAPDEDASAFLYRMFRIKPTLFEDRIELLQCIDILIKRGVKHPDYVRILTERNFLNLTVEEKDELSLKLLEIENLDSFFWHCIFKNKILNDRWIKRLSDSFLKMDSHQELLGLAINYDSSFEVEDELIQSICKKVLNLNILELNPELVISVFNLSSSELINLKIQVSRAILENKFLEKVNERVVIIALESIKDIDIALTRDICSKLLDINNFDKFKPILIAKAFKYSNEKIIKGRLARYVMLNKSGSFRNISIIHKSLEFFTHNKLILPDYVNHYIEKTIDEYHLNSTNEEAEIKYSLLMNLPFHLNSRWVKEKQMSNKKGTRRR
jgi:hypothetical protein